MNIKKKALGIGMSAGLIASLLATAIAPAALAAITIGSAGNVPVGGTSASNVSFQFTEQAIASIPTNAVGSFTVTIAPAAPGLGSVSFAGTPSTGASTGSLGATASIAGSVLTVNIAGSDTTQIESIFVTGLKISAAAGTSLGAITATLSAGTGSLAGAAAIFSGGGTATGTISAGIGAGATSVIVNVTSAGCIFRTTALSGNPLSFATSPETSNITAATGLGTPGVGQQTLTIVATANVHNAAELVSEANGCAASATLASPGTVVAAITYSSAGNASVFPGENNSPASNLTLVEPSAGFLAAGSTFTYTILTPGVVFSTAPSVGSTTSQQTITFGATGFAHAAGTTLTQVQGAPTSCTASGLLVNAILAGATSGIFQLTTPLCPFLVTAGTVGNVTLGAPNSEGGPALTVTAATPPIGLSAAVVSASRTSATVTVTVASTAPATITLSGILYDLLASVPGGTFISVGLTTSAAQAVLPPTNTNAVVFRGILASAPSPTVYIGQNNQTAGLITFTESQAGFFTAGVGTGTNTIMICPTGVLYTFTTAPVAMVVGGVAAGNLILRNGAAASTTNIVPGLQNGACYFWYVWTASTTPSTIVIGAAPSAATGPLINVSVAQTPGGVDTNLFVGSSNVQNSLFATVQFATAAYLNQVAVTALSDPFISAGSSHAAGGNLQIAETGLGQLKLGENICVQVLPRTFLNQDTFLNGLNTADLPVVTASGTGLVVGPVTANASQGCNADHNATIPSQYMQSFSFPVLQQSTAGNGMLVISNINYTTLADAVTGAVQLSVWGFGGAPTTVIFHSTVTDATIGTAPAIMFNLTGTALGNTLTGPFTPGTKISHGGYITWRFDGGAALANQTIQIWAYKKSALFTNPWSAVYLLTTRVTNASGVAYANITSHSVIWLSIRPVLPASGSMPAVWGPWSIGRWVH